MLSETVSADAKVVREADGDSGAAAAAEMPTLLQLVPLTEQAALFGWASARVVKSRSSLLCLAFLTRLCSRRVGATSSRETRCASAIYVCHLAARPAMRFNSSLGKRAPVS